MLGSDQSEQHNRQSTLIKQAIYMHNQLFLSCAIFYGSLSRYLTANVFLRLRLPLPSTSSSADLERVFSRRCRTHHRNQGTGLD